MKQQLHRRLAELERVSEARERENPPDSGPAAIEIIRHYLRSRGFEQGPTESLAETQARALGINCRELAQRLATGTWADLLPP